jgi:hypothetical protein
MGATRRSLQAQPKILKKIIRTPNLPIRSKIRYLKKEKAQKTRMGVTRRNLQAQPKILKKSSPNLPIRTKNFPKKNCF